MPSEKVHAQSVPYRRPDGWAHPQARCLRPGPKALPPTRKAPLDLATTTTETSPPNNPAPGFVFIPFANTKRGRRKGRNTAIAHSMRVFRQKERDLQSRGPAQTAP